MDSEHQTFETMNSKNSGINNFRCSKSNVGKAEILLGCLQRTYEVYEGLR